MPEKRTQNKFRDGIGDYYKTNRKISEESEKSKKGTPISSREKAMIIMIIFLLIALTVKSTVLDEVKNLSPEEQQFKDFVEYSISEQYDGFFEDSGLMVYRVYDLYMADKDAKGVLRYKDPKTGEMVDVVQDGRYNARVRGYFLWILPVKHFSVTAKIEK
ncbi:MAG: hypothetical protein AAGU75_06850 [Bacillota bacterium]